VTFVVDEREMDGGAVMVRGDLRTRGRVYSVARMVPRQEVVAGATPRARDDIWRRLKKTADAIGWLRRPETAPRGVSQDDLRRAIGVDAETVV